jgi:GMP synthase (glutamine-hydrolysing)
MGLRIVVVDFGGQYTHLIARRVRELGVYSEIVEPESLREALEKGGVGGIILSGGPKAVLEAGAPTINLNYLSRLDIPILGICYGHQLMAKEFGGELARSSYREYGRMKVRVIHEDELFRGLPSSFWVWMSHWDTVIKPPEGWIATSISEKGIITSMSDGKRFYSTQFHPEVSHTEYGYEILENFLRKICKINPWWSPGDQVSRIIEEIRNTVGEDERVICAVSGGVDSVTTAVLVSKAVGERLYSIFIDTGLLRKNERENVENTLRNLGIKNLIVVDAAGRFLEKLKGVRDPEEKRKIIGEEFIRVFEEVSSKIENVRWLAQGTIYPDRVESGKASRHSALIKSHHNVGGLPEKMSLKILEPLRDFYKDEVRAIAKKLGIPREIWARHPFPGPGLAVRIIGEVNEEKLKICRDASAIIEEELMKSGVYDMVWQAFAVVGDDRWIGVMGDDRIEGYIVTIRIVESIDGMTADWHRIDYEIIDKISRRITNEVFKVTMVTYAVSSKPPSTIEPC